MDPECVSAYNDFKLSKKIAFIVFGFNKELTKIVVLNSVAKNATEDTVKAKSKKFTKILMKKCQMYYYFVSSRRPVGWVDPIISQWWCAICCGRCSLQHCGRTTNWDGILVMGTGDCQCQAPHVDGQQQGRLKKHSCRLQDQHSGLLLSRSWLERHCREIQGLSRLRPTRTRLFFFIFANIYI